MSKLNYTYEKKTLTRDSYMIKPDVFQPSPI